MVPKSDGFVNSVKLSYSYEILYSDRFSYSETFLYLEKFLYSGRSSHISSYIFCLNKFWSMFHHGSVRASSE